jgi:hypothetical protein
MRIHIVLCAGALAAAAAYAQEHQSKGTVAAVSLDKKRPEERIQLGGYTLTAGLVRGFRNPNEVPDITGYGIFLATGPDEFLMAGDNLQISFMPTTAGPPIASVAQQEAGRFENGKWVVTRLLGGDDSVLRYDFANRRRGAIGQRGALALAGAGDSKSEIIQVQVT